MQIWTLIILTMCLALGDMDPDVTSQNMSPEHPSRIHHDSRIKRRVCYGSHGCFSWNGDFYHIKWRPVMYNPYFDVSRIKYGLYTRRNKNHCDFLKRNDAYKLRASSFNSQRRTIMIIHGWTQIQKSSIYSGKYGFSWSPFNTAAPKWVWKLKDALLDRDDLNVIVVDWTVGSDYHYMKAAPNTRLAGADIALMVKYLKTQTGAKTADFHVIGHSLGGHVAGYVGSRLREMGYTLGRITGLDPAEEYFERMPKSVRLDPTDAAFVDVIHTNGGYGPVGICSGLGVIEPCGHVDFYVNGGRDQPGCNSPACSHSRAHELFLSSVKGLCTYKPRYCFRYEGKWRYSYSCDTKYVRMGYEADTTRFKLGGHRLQLHIETTGYQPYCPLPVRHQYYSVTFSYCYM